MHKKNKSGELEALVRISNELDINGLFKEADELDKIITKLSQETAPQFWQTPHGQHIKNTLDRYVKFTHDTNTVLQNFSKRIVNLENSLKQK